MTLPKRARHDELNIARLNLVLAQNRTKLTRWRKEVTLDALGTITAECVADADNVVPHGIDNDILVGLISAAVIQNVEPGGEVRLTVAELLKLSCLSTGAKNYAAVQQSLTRLKRSTMTIRESWFDQGKNRWRSVSFNLIAKHWEDDNTEKQEDIGRLQADTLLVVRLDPELTRSVRYGYIRPLDSYILERLRQPMCRSVYRALSLLRTNITGEIQTVPSVVTIPLLAWAEHLGITLETDGRPRADIALRALAPAHTALVKANYLRDVTCEGRGRHKVITYRFATDEVQAADPESAQLLSRVLSKQKALELSAQYGAPHVRKVMEQFDELMATDYRTKVKSEGGLLVDMLRNPDKYTTVNLSPTPSAPKRTLPKPEPEPDVPISQAAFDMCFRALPSYAAPLQKRFWDLYASRHILGMHIINLRDRPLEDLEAQLNSWEAASQTPH